MKRKKKDTDTQMSVTFMCPNLRCRKILMAPQGTRGKRVRCSYCGTTLIVPSKKKYFSDKGIVSNTISTDDNG